MRRKLPTDRHGLTQATTIDGTRVYIQTGEYDDGTIGEIFLKVGKEGAKLRVYDCVAIMASLLLQNGVTLESICDKMIGVQMEPAGLTTDSNIPLAKSIIDYVFRWLKSKYIKEV